MYSTLNPDGSKVSGSSSVANAYYATDGATFISTRSDAVLGGIAANNPFPVDPTQRDAWVVQNLNSHARTTAGNDSIRSAC